MFFFRRLRRAWRRTRTRLYLVADHRHYRIVQISHADYLARLVSDYRWPCCTGFRLHDGGHVVVLHERPGAWLVVDLERAGRLGRLLTDGRDADAVEGMLRRLHRPETPVERPVTLRWVDGATHTKACVWCRADGAERGVHAVV